jgi:hypothetical protein
MKSEDYKDRFKAEYWQVKTRFNKLCAMYSKMKEGTLDFKPTCPIEIYTKQLDAMAQYIGILEKRAELEGINLYK